MTTFHDFTLKTIDGDPKALRDYSGKVLLVVNVASRCGLTPQYTALEELHRKYSGQGFSVVAFPCNDFAGQEPGDESEIKAFCSTTYDVSFPLFAKVHVNGSERTPLYGFLTGESAPPKGPGDVAWNFEKFLIDRAGQVQGRFDPGTAPLDPAITAAVERLLG